MRLAERQGLLHQRQLSRVQTQALQTLMVLDAKQEYDKAQNQVINSFRSAMAAAYPLEAPQLWPEIFTEEERRDLLSTPDEIDQALEDEGETTWVFEDPNAYTADEVMAILGSLNKTVSLTPEDVDNDKGWV